MPITRRPTSSEGTISHQPNGRESLDARHSLPRAAFEYAREQSWLGRSLGEAIGEELQPERFSAYAWAAKEASVQRLLAFHEGGLPTVGDIWRHLFADIAKAMLSVDSRWVVPHPLARASDPFLADELAEYVVVNDEVYYVGRERSEQSVASVWRSAGAACGQMGAVIAATAALAPGAHELERCAQETRLVIITAYDGEGAVVFRRTGAA